MRTGYKNSDLVNSAANPEKKDFLIVLISLFGYDFGIRYVSSFLKEKGYQTYIVQFNQLRYVAEFLDNDYFTPSPLNHNICPPQDLKLLIDLLKELKPKVIGISLTSMAMKTAKIITLEIKKNLDCLVVWGGVHAIISPEECIRYADVVCIGEGETPMWELVEKIRQEEPVSGVKNLWIKNNTGVEKNELSPLIDDLDSLPFADFVGQGNKFLIEKGRILKLPFIISGYDAYGYPIMSSRGCMFSCSYCCNSIIQEKYRDKGPYLRRRSVRNVIEELKIAIQNSSMRVVRFWDDVFTYDKEWIKEFCGVYLKEIGKPFSCYAHPKYTDKDILVDLANVGLVSIIAGIQSGSEAVNKEFFARSQSNHDILKFANTIKPYFNPSYDFISDNPYESDQEQDNSAEFLLKLPHPYLMQFYSLCYFPKTPLTQKALADKVIGIEDLEQYSSKALNNFFMFLPLSKTKRQLFWNCIKAMAVNRRFPKAIVRLSKRSNFFKKHPKVLFLLSRYYLYLFKGIGKKKLRISPIPSLVRRAFFIDGYLILRSAKFLFYSPKFLFRLFPLRTNNNSKKFCLKVTNMLQGALPVRFLIEAVPLREKKLSNKTIWSIESKIDRHNNIYLDLQYPELSFSIDNNTNKTRLLRKGNFESSHSQLYVLKIKFCILKKSIFKNRSKYWIVEQVLCDM